jgi:hypothetical protein
MNNLRVLAALCLMVGYSSQALAHSGNQPNDPCAVAQDIGAVDVTSPFTVSGSLDTPPDDPDVDFFKFGATPGASVIVDVQRADSGAGTLSDPFLGLFDSDCNFVG